MIDIAGIPTGVLSAADVQADIDRECEVTHAAARAVAVSPLVKTALNGCDPNWGRIVQALGATSVAFKPERVTVRLDKTVLFRHGAPAPRLDARKLTRIMRRKRVPLTLDLGAGRASDTVLTCDLSRDYVTINADYHT